MKTPTKEEIVKLLYNCGKKTETSNGIELKLMFEDQAEAILELFSAPSPSTEVKGQTTAEEFLDEKFGEEVKYWNDTLSVKRIVETMEEYASLISAEKDREIKNEKLNSESLQRYWDYEKEKVVEKDKEIERLEKTASRAQDNCDKLSADLADRDKQIEELKAEIQKGKKFLKGLTKE